MIVFDKSMMVTVEMCMKYIHISLRRTIMNT